MPREIGALNRVVVADTYTTAASIIAPTTRAITIFVYNNAVIYELAYDPNGLNFDPGESELGPGYFSLSRTCSAIRFRNEVAGQVALISVKMLGG